MRRGGFEDLLGREAGEADQITSVHPFSAIYSPTLGRTNNLVKVISIFISSWMDFTRNGRKNRVDKRRDKTIGDIFFYLIFNVITSHWQKNIC